jgi:hypothetical protein
LTLAFKTSIVAAAALVIGTAHAGVPAARTLRGGVEAQSPRTPTATLIRAPRIDLPAQIDSSNPAVWSLVRGVHQLVVISSWGGIPIRTSGATLERLRIEGPVGFRSHPGHGVWMEAIVPDAAGRWYGFYHHERPADLCGRPDRQLPRIGALRSFDNGLSWEDLGIILDAPPGSEACDSANRFVLGGVGDLTAALDADGTDLYLYYSQYLRDGASQGVVVARLAWANRDAPAGKTTVWNNGAWLAASQAADGSWSYPRGTPLFRNDRPFHDASADNDILWGPSIHWNTYLNRYVMLLNRAENDHFGQEGIYVSFSPTLAPSRWSAPVRMFDGGEWYPQVIGEETGVGTDRLTGKRARFFMLGRSDYFIQFAR